MASHAPGLAEVRRTTGLWLEAVSATLARQARTEWFGSPPHLLSIAHPKGQGFAAFPRDFRPARREAGAALLEGAWTLAGAAMNVGPGGDPWNRPSPGRAAAEALHRFGWLRDLLAMDERGAREGLRLVSEWRAIFGRWNSFSWSGQILERRVLNLACAMGPIAAHASEAEVEMLADLLARQARQLLIARDPAWRRAERAVAAGVAAAALSGKAGDRLLAAALGRINRTVLHAVLPDGGHVSRSPEGGLELLLDLLALDDGWAQRGFQLPEEAARALDRLTAAMRFLTLPDGRLACFQGGEPSQPSLIAAARAHDDAEAAGPPPHLPHTGYQRLIGRSIQVMVDVGRPAPAPWSASACAQPGAIEVVCRKERLITNSGWSLRAAGANALRLTDAGSTAALDHASTAAPLSGWRSRALGPRLMGGPVNVEVRRAASDAGSWLDLTHDGWGPGLGLLHGRRLFVDLASDELRGEDQFTPVNADQPTRLIPYVIYFHLPPEVEAAIARDQKSVLLRGPSDKGWWLRNDATEVRVEPAVHFRDGRQVPSRMVLLAGHIRADKGGKVRWKLAAVE